MLAAASNDVLREIAPTGELRAALNLGNQMLVEYSSAGELVGVTPALARELASRLGIGVNFVCYERAEDVTNSANRERWDVCFLAIDPLRARKIDFTPAYATISGVYVVPDDSHFASAADVDASAVRIGVSEGSAYDLHLTRHIRRASIVRTKDPTSVLALLQNGAADVIGGVQGMLEQAVANTPRYRLLPGAFMAINQAMGVPIGRPLAHQFASSFVEAVKASGFVARLLAESGQPSARVADAV